MTCRIKHAQVEVGVRAVYRNQFTGKHVVIYDGAEVGLDTDGGRWQVVCEEHGNILSTETLALAKSAAKEPEEWCEQCRGQTPSATWMFA